MPKNASEAVKTTHTRGWFFFLKFRQ